MYYKAPSNGLSLLMATYGDVLCRSLMNIRYFVDCYGRASPALGQKYLYNLYKVYSH